MPFFQIEPVLWIQLLGRIGTTLHDTKSNAFVLKSYHFSTSATTHVVLFCMATCYMCIHRWRVQHFSQIDPDNFSTHVTPVIRVTSCAIDRGLKKRACRVVALRNLQCMHESEEIYARCPSQGLLPVFCPAFESARRPNGHEKSI